MSVLSPPSDTIYGIQQRVLSRPLWRPEQPARGTRSGKPYRIPFNELFVSGNELSSMAESVMSGHVCGDGSFTKLCQHLLEERFSARQVLLTTSCTAALEMAALLLDIGVGD